MSLDGLFEKACDWKDGKCRTMRVCNIDYNCCSHCKFYQKNDRRGCPLGNAKPSKCRHYLCDAARDWVAQYGNSVDKKALARLDREILVMAHRLAKNRKDRARLGLGLGNAIRKVARAMKIFW